MGNLVAYADCGEAGILEVCIWDLSSGGACLLVPASTELPNSFNLIIDDLPQGAEVVWRKWSLIGIRFVAEPKKASSRRHHWTVVCQHMADDRRSEPRHFVGEHLLRLDLGRDQEPVSCFVWDISERGARLKLPKPLELPRIVNVLKGDVLTPAAIAWQKQDQIGIEFFPAQ